MSYLKNAALLASLCATSVAAQASVHTIEFSATGMNPFEGSDPVPQAEVAGSFVVELTGLYISKILGVDLTIAGHKYEVDELVVTRYPEFNMIGAKPNANGLVFGEDDFWLEVSPYKQIEGFAYTSSQSPSSAYQALWMSYAYTPNPIPEPASVPMVIGGLAVVGVSSRKAMARALR